MTKLKKKFSNPVVILTVVGVLFLLGIFLKTNNSIPRLSDNLLTSKPTEEGLKNQYNMFHRLLNEHKWGEVYDQIYSTEKRSSLGSREEYITANEKLNEKYPNFKINYQFMNVSILGNKGYVDATHNFCITSPCTGKEKSYRNYKVFVYDKGQWYLTSDDPLCIRNTGYNIRPEFSRAISLITQRYNQAGNTSWESAINKIANCLDIKYADSSDELVGAEGMFTFVPGQSSEKLEILVSPKYVVKDDLITALLLVHEITHANDYIVNLHGIASFDCYKMEQRAFGQTVYFYRSILNDEERSSIGSRYYSDKSQEINQFIDTTYDMLTYSGDTSDEKILNYIKSSPYYQKQCSSTH